MDDGDPARFAHVERMGNLDAQVPPFTNSCWPVTVYRHRLLFGHAFEGRLYGDKFVGMAGARGPTVAGGLPELLVAKPTLASGRQRPIALMVVWESPVTIHRRHANLRPRSAAPDCALLIRVPATGSCIGIGLASMKMLEASERQPELIPELQTKFFLAVGVTDGALHHLHWHRPVICYGQPVQVKASGAVASKAAAARLVWLVDHCETNVGWLAPHGLV